ncbi:MAG TPA: L-2-hydroxyglutarate oxidase [Spirochaetota bacterium]|nr:L-2-hydroxyglutarate oxidase [Spirochaetota bacterium]HOR92722.1 L-2-hydroxyglutarate oxidase [Spirochaetota bacterium]HRR59822.1 L-2-hydroxyglutarate oxidase [Spirochaetota bacterium]
MKAIKVDYCIIGAGVVGLAIARELSLRTKKTIVVCEKEAQAGFHASGRNSGVLHAGIYYTQGSLKANTCIEGNRLMKEFCAEKGVAVKESGKVIVAKNQHEVPTLYELEQRAKNNGVTVELINEKKLEQIEPCARTNTLALFSPHTAVVDPKVVMQALYHDCIQRGITVLLSTPFKQFTSDTSIIAGNHTITYDKLINCAGAHSDTIAHTKALAKHLALIPFKGIYIRLKPDSKPAINGNIYPVPDIRNPFLGVHFTRDPYGNVYIGPTAMPVFGREHYGKLQGLGLESIDILFKDALLFIANKSFRSVALDEPKKYIPYYFYKDAKELVKELSYHDIESAAKIGIRPQLVDWTKKELVMDFCIYRDATTVHVLNAISPAFTSSLYFAKIIVDSYCM